MKVISNSLQKDVLSNSVNTRYCVHYDSQGGGQGRPSGVSSNLCSACGKLKGVNKKKFNIFKACITQLLFNLQSWFATQSNHNKICNPKC